VEESCLAVGRSNDEQKQGQLETHRTWCYTGLPDNKEKKTKLFKYFFYLLVHRKKKTNKTVFTPSVVSAIIFSAANNFILSFTHSKCREKPKLKLKQLLNNRQKKLLDKSRS